MGKFLILVGLVLAACGGDEDVPSCQQAMTGYYGANCTFFDLQTGQPYTLNESISLCQQVNSAVPDRCQSFFDDWVSCLDGVATEARCTDCSQEQDALFGCQ